MKLTQDQFETVKAMITDYLADGSNFKDGLPKSVDIILTGSAAWEVGHRSGAVNFLYEASRDIVDAHIKTALAKIFPNAIFKDKYSY